MSIWTSVKARIPRAAKRFVRRVLHGSEQGIRDLSAPFLPPIVCVDIGASYMPHYKWRLLLESPSIHWIAVEPNSKNLGYVEQWQWPCDVYVVASALSGDGGPATLYVTNVDSGSSLLEPVETASMIHREHGIADDYYFPLTKRSIDTLTLPQVIAGHPSAPVCVKLDTQGTELSILSGAQQLLADHRIVGLETEASLLAQPTMKGTGKFWEICRYLEDLGFELLLIDLHPGFSMFGIEHARGRRYVNECDATFAVRRDVARSLPVESRAALFAFYLTNRLYEEAHSLLTDDLELRAYFEARGCEVARLASAIRAAA